MSINVLLYLVELSCELCTTNLLIITASELLLFVLIWGLGVIIFSVIMYYAEGDKNTKMNSILAAR